MNTLHEIVIEANQLYAEIHNPLISNEDYDKKIERLLSISLIQNLKDKSDIDIATLLSFRFHLLDSINLLGFMKYQGKINRHLNKLFKSIEANVVDLEKSLDEQENYQRDSVNNNSDNFGIF